LIFSAFISSNFILFGEKYNFFCWFPPLFYFCLVWLLSNSTRLVTSKLANLKLCLLPFLAFFTNSLETLKIGGSYSALSKSTKHILKLCQAFGVLRPYLYTFASRPLASVSYHNKTVNKTKQSFSIKARKSLPFL
jgi:hypothetical protein